MRTPEQYLELLEKVREEKSLNVIDFSEKELGISKATYYRWKKGKPPNSIEFYQKIDKYLESYQYLIST